MSGLRTMPVITGTQGKCWLSQDTVIVQQLRACSKVIQASPGGLMKMPFSAASHTGSAPNASSSRPCAGDVFAVGCCELTVAPISSRCK